MGSRTFFSDLKKNASLKHISINIGIKNQIRGMKDLGLFWTSKMCIQHKVSIPQVWPEMYPLFLGCTDITDICCSYDTYTHIQYKHIISQWSCIRLESLQPWDCQSNTDNWCGRGCDNSQIWQVKCFYLQGKRVPACASVSVWVCVPYAVRKGGLSATYWCACIVVNNSSKRIQRWQLWCVWQF